MNPDFSKARILVVGDVILDKYYFGKVNRISPEAPVPIVRVVSEKYSPGGSGNVVNNLNGLRTRSFHICITGDDPDSDILGSLLENPNTKNSFIKTSTRTVTKIRVIGEHQQVVRLDFEELQEIELQAENSIISTIQKSLDEINAVIISDYGKGLCTYKICRYLIDESNKRNIPAIIDPKGHDWEKYSGATIITPNVKELGAVYGREIANTDREIEKYGTEIMKKYSLRNILVTRSDRGMTLISGLEVHHIPTDALEVYDVSGAGDTVVAALAAGLASGRDMTDSAKIANRAAGLVVQKFGTAPVELDELVHSYHNESKSKILPVDLMIKTIERMYNKGEKIFFLPGKFNSIDVKLINRFKEIKNNNDILIAGIVSDSNSETAEIIAGFELVDYVVILNGNNFPDEIKKKLCLK